MFFLEIRSDKIRKKSQLATKNVHFISIISGISREDEGKYANRR